MKNFADSIVNFLKEEDGPTAVEYAVMLALIVVVCLAAVGTIGTNANAKFEAVGTAIACELSSLSLAFASDMKQNLDAVRRGSRCVRSVPSRGMFCVRIPRSTLSLDQLPLRHHPPHAGDPPDELPTPTRRCCRLCVATLLLPRDASVRDVQLDDRPALKPHTLPYRVPHSTRTVALIAAVTRSLTNHTRG